MREGQGGFRRFRFFYPRTKKGPSCQWRGEPFLPRVTYIYFPVTLSLQARMASGAPAATSLPPWTPPPGPMSIT